MTKVRDDAGRETGGDVHVDAEAADGGAHDDAASPPPVVAGDGPSWSWYLVRVSGLFLAVLLPLHFAVVIVRDDVGRTTLATVTERFADGRWQAVELVTLLLALLHGFLALRSAVLRSARLSPAAATRTIAGLGVVAGLLAVSLMWAMVSLA